MNRVAVLDACVLYPYHLRDFLIRLAIDGNFYQPKWSEEIHKEWTRNLLKNRPDLDHGALRRTVHLMNRLPDTLVSRHSYEGLISECNLPDPGDNHVLAAAIACNAHYIVTFNLRDFPAQLLKPRRVVAIHPDEFVLQFVQDSPATPFSDPDFEKLGIIYDT